MAFLRGKERKGRGSLFAERKIDSSVFMIKNDVTSVQGIIAGYPGCNEYAG